MKKIVALFTLIGFVSAPGLFAAGEECAKGSGQDGCCAKAKPAETAKSETAKPSTCPAQGGSCCPAKTTAAGSQVTKATKAETAKPAPGAAAKAKTPPSPASNDVARK